MRVRHDVSTVLKSPQGYLIVRKNNDEWRLLKGGVEDGETEEEALHREVSEEVDLEIEILSEVHRYQYEADGILHKVSVYSSRTEDTEVTLQEEELQDYKWLTLEELKNQVKFENEVVSIEKAEDHF